MHFQNPRVTRVSSIKRAHNRSRHCDESVAHAQIPLGVVCNRNIHLYRAPNCASTAFKHVTFHFALFKQRPKRAVDAIIALSKVFCVCL